MSTAHKKNKMLAKFFLLFKTLRCCIYLAYNNQNAINCRHFYNIYEQDKFHAHRVEQEKKFYNLGANLRDLGPCGTQAPKLSYRDRLVLP